MSQVSRGTDRVRVVFDEANLVANAGLLLVATVVARLDLEALIEATVCLVGRPAGRNPGAKVLTLVNTLIAGGNHIGHADVLRAGATARVVGHRVYAPSTIGSFLRSFTFGHVRQLEAVVGKAIERAWAAGGGPGEGRLVIDVDSTICQVYGKAKAGAAYGYTKVLGYHPILATRADTGEILHARMRKGSANTARGTRRFVEELAARVRRAGAAGEIILRFDSGYWSADTIRVLARLNVRYTMAVRANHKGPAKAINTIDETGWTPIAYTPDGEAAVAETTYNGRRLIVRRTRLTGAAQRQLWPDWRHFAFLTDLPGDPVTLDAFHRQHAVVELCIDDLKEGSGLDHVPSGHYSANSAWLCAAVLAHNLTRWTATLGAAHRPDHLTVAATIRNRLINIPARLVNRAGTLTLRGPRRWPWAAWFTHRLNRLRALPAPSG